MMEWVLARVGRVGEGRKPGEQSSDGEGGSPSPCHDPSS